MNEMNLPELNQAQCSELQKTVTECVLNSVLRGIPLSDICRLTSEDNPEWIRGSALVINKIMEHLVGKSVNGANSDPRYGVIIPTMSGLEWAPANLTGHGGTEVDGLWYYTYDQAVAAVKELGDGWRLPTEEEFEKLCDAGSTWVDEGPDGRPGRWFGGNHDTDHNDSIFLPAAGCLGFSSGAVTGVGASGYCWSSSPCSSEVRAGSSSFGSGGVYPVNSIGRAYGFSVRCVREL